jgi:aminomethyltransferase
LEEVGAPFGIQPIGLGARDTLRLEACLPLYGHELDETTSPLEIGYGWTVKLDKGDFIGRDKLVKQKEKGLPKQLIGLVTEGQALPRQGYAIKLGKEQVGQVTSGSKGLCVGYPIALGFVKPELAHVGESLTVDIRGVDVPAKVVAIPFYKRQR